MPEHPIRTGASEPLDDLSGFRWHTGAVLRRVAAAEPVPVLFRDLGPKATALFLRGRLPRLAGPLSPIVYMRTADYQEPYTDHERIGRLAILRPRSLGVWHSGVAHVYVARARPGVDRHTIGFVPGDIPLADAARRAADVTNTREWRAALGRWAHDEAVAESLYRLDGLEEELARSEELADPLRKALQSSDRRTREEARDAMIRVGLTESDLCTAWHHLPRSRRAAILESLCRLPSPAQGGAT